MADEAKALALELAREFDGGYGGEVTAALHDMSQSRAFGVSEALAVAGLLLAGVQTAMQWKSDRKAEDLQALLNELLGRPEKVSEEKRAGIIRRIVEKFRGRDGE
jgi:hypothetical protein